MPEDRVTAALEQFPGPITVGPSATKYLLAIGICIGSVAAGMFFIRHAETVAATLATSHGAVRGIGYLYLLVLLRLAQNMTEAVTEFGWFTVIFFGLGAVVIVLQLVLGVVGVLGLTLTKEGFTLATFNLWTFYRRSYHRWRDVGGFDSEEFPVAVLGRLGAGPFARKCVVFNDYRGAENPIKELSLVGRNRALPGVYELSVDDLVVLFSVWRERALTSV